MSDAPPDQAHPTILAERISEGRVELDLHLPAQLLFFRGHFDTYPVLPGIVQLHWAVHYARRYFVLEESFPSSFLVKFRDLIRPGEALTLSLERRAQRIAFEYKTAGQSRSLGQVTFTP